VITRSVPGALGRNPAREDKEQYKYQQLRL